MSGADPDSPPGTAEALWLRLLAARADGQAPWRTPILATIGLDGAPRARTIVLRSADPASGRVSFHSDSRAGKMAEIARDPRVALTFHDPGAGDRAPLQLRLEGCAAIETDPALLAEAWERVPEAARRNYCGRAAPGTSVPAHEAAAGEGEAHFAIVHVTATRLEWLWLGPKHRRGVYERTPAGWRGVLLAP